MHADVPTGDTATAAPPVTPAMQLASSVHVGPGVNALLLGSGISINAGVPSGKAVVCELVERLAEARGEDTRGDPIDWYREHAGHEPDYRTLLEEAVPSPADRRNLLSKHFEPKVDNGGLEGPLPTRAHHAVARLVAGGFVRVIVTTSFDRLLETALADAGVHPQVISNAATAQSAEPLQHSRCTVIKVSGDYVSSDIRNSTEELDSYEPTIDSLLSRVFEEYGLMVCGWSASLDTALRKAILRASNRRYSTFWMDRGSLTPEAAEIVSRRSAIRVPIEDADSAFEQAADTVAALSQVPQQRPAATTASVQQLKLHMSDPSHYIHLHNLIVRETERVIEDIAGLPTSDVDLNAVYPERVHRYKAASGLMMSLLATGARRTGSDVNARCSDAWRVGSCRGQQMGVPIGLGAGFSGRSASWVRASSVLFVGARHVASANSTAAAPISSSGTARSCKSPVSATVNASDRGATSQPAGASAR